MFQDHESYFSNIKSQELRDNPSSGHKLALENQIQRFHNSHMMVIRKKLSPSSQMCHVAVASLGMTVAWASRFFLYIDKTYLTYSVGKCGPEKSWHVTTKLATALLLEMSKLREGMFDTLDSGAENKIFNARVVFLQHVEIAECYARYS